VRSSLAVFLIVCFANAGAAQNDDLLESDYWLDVFYPKVFYTARDGFTGGAYFAFMQPVRFTDFDSPPPYRALVSLDAQASASGSRFAKLQARLPQFVEGWRFTGMLIVRRDARDNYFGIGSSTAYDGNNVTDAQPHFYQALHTRSFLRVEVQRQLIGPLRLLAGVDAQHWKIEPPEGPSLLAQDAAASVDPTIGIGTTDVSARFGLVFDSRNDEVFPERGVFIGVVGSGASANVVGDVSYSRFTFAADGHIPVTTTLNLNARVTASAMGGTPRLGSLYQLVNSAFSGMGGGESHRGLFDNRYLGRHQLLANVDLRYTLAQVPTLYRVSIIGFLDAGRVFQGESFRLTTDDLQVGGGGGIFLQVGRAGLLGFTGGAGPDGAVFHFYTRWPY